jgi:hypothetical protein
MYDQRRNASNIWAADSVGTGILETTATEGGLAGVQSTDFRPCVSVPQISSHHRPTATRTDACYGTASLSGRSRATSRPAGNPFPQLSWPGQRDQRDRRSPCHRILVGISAHQLHGREKGAPDVWRRDALGGNTNLWLAARARPIHKRRCLASRAACLFNRPHKQSVNFDDL